ncbi:glycoside hydrolase family 10 protein [Mangrovibacterium marinum]|uniref:Uncharacterized lipoprotein YddW (UPF0748 family) n=1 Tax=Mangrovibacterium marinum TaxID=1639118 RepID=A0A2T5BZJ5_9BACT|nr:family 10 glycosylhydrolase [Mangrovibacterium marinum]PTN07684.1 uncharacterized lipoprotein YddW (UPF0748 family) [Mangrovibacterium marinum]
MIRKITSTLLIVLAVSLATVGEVPPKYEFRAAWVATVNNIDWPSKPGLSIEKQKEEALALLDLMAENGLNAVIFQLRPTADSFYPSQLEPWSRYLTGTPGKDPGYDPLKFWIDEAHKRKLEFHAWINPFRIAQKATEELSSSSIVFQHPEWVVEYGGKLYFNPALDETRQFIAAVVRDILQRYDIDAIHCDDYFYPYPVAGVPFPDAADFAQNPRHFGPDQLADWRRNNVDLTIQLLSKTIKETKPWVKFGISPFGVWRNNDQDPRGSMTRAGVTNYDDLYADILKWLEQGWIDYITPQLYWQIGHPAADYLSLIDWWSQNAFQRDVYIGLGLYRIDAKSATEEWTRPDQMPQQIRLTRTTPNIKGSSLYSVKHLKRNLLGLQDSLQNKLFATPALTPQMPWIDPATPQSPRKLKKRGRKLKWKKPSFNNPMDEAIRYIVYKTPAGKKPDLNDPRSIYTITNEQHLKLDRRKGKRRPYDFRVTALGKLNNESRATKAKTLKY